MFKKLKKGVKKLNPLSDSLLMKDKVFDCESFESEFHPFHNKGFIFPNGLVEIEGSGTLLTASDKDDFSNENIDKTLFFFNAATTSAEVVKADGDITDFETLLNCTTFSRFMLRNLEPMPIKKIIFKDLR